MVSLAEAPVRPAWPLSLSALLAGTALDHLSTTLAEEDLGEWAMLPRVKLLARLKHLGVSAIAERQALANAFARSQRGLAPEWKPPAEKTERRASACAAPAPPPPPTMPVGTPVFDSDELPGSAPTTSLEELRRQLLAATTTHEVVGGQVRLAVEASSPLRVFGECADASCGCYRLKEPRVRARFRNLVVARTAAQLEELSPTGATAAVRYVSLGSGSLLTDAEILSGLLARGLAIESITLVDPEYRRTRMEVEQQLLREMAALFAPARVLAFDSLADLREAVQAAPDVHGRATTVVQIDANAISSLDTTRVPSQCLITGGLAFELLNQGARKAGWSCRRRTPRPLPQKSELRSASGDLDGLLETVAIEESEGFVDPLGICEPVDSQARALFEGIDEAGHATDRSFCGGVNAWQNRQNGKSPSESEAELNAALNLL